MNGVLRALALVLPVVVALGAGVVKAASGQWGLSMALSLVAGGLLGWTIALLARTAATLAGVAGAADPRRATREQLRGERAAVARAIAELEQEVELQRTAPDAAEAMLAPLRAEIARLEGQLAGLPEGGDPTADEQIERELERRVREAGS